MGEDADGKPLPTLVCYKCDEEGHLAKNCRASAGEKGDSIVTRGRSKPRRPRVLTVSHATQDVVYDVMLKGGMSDREASAIAHAAAGAASQCALDLESRVSRRKTSLPRDRSRSRNRPEKSDNCYRCGKPGHKLKECPKARKSRSRSPRGKTLVCF